MLLRLFFLSAMMLMVNFNYGKSPGFSGAHLPQEDLHPVMTGASHGSKSICVNFN